MFASILGGSIRLLFCRHTHTHTHTMLLIFNIIRFPLFPVNSTVRFNLSIMNGKEYGSTNHFLHVCTFMILDSPTKWVSYLVSAWWGSIIILDRCTYSLSSGAIRVCVPLLVTTM